MSNKRGETDMKQEAKRESKPKLRFPEFQDGPAWSKRPLEDALSPIVQQIMKPTNAYTGLGIRSHGKGTFLKNHEIPEKNSMEYLYEVQSDDLVVNITFAWEGAIAIAKQADAGALVSHRFPTYTFKRTVAIPEFFQYIILDKQFIYRLGVISPGGAGRNRVLNKSDFLELTVLLPDLDEQQKIADCLSSIDDLIAAQSQKLDALKAHKKGLLQQLFPVEDESLPKLRFPEFQNSPEWEEKRLENVAPLQRGFDLPSTEIQPGDVPVVYSNGVLKFHNKAMAKAPGLVTGRSGTIGKFHFIEKDYWPHNTSLWVTSFNTNYPKFVYYLYQTIGIEKFASGSGVPTLNRNDVHAQQVLLPLSKLEQKKIADFLSLIDELIAIQSQKLDMLKAHKKGLMRQLFPSTEDMQ
jgi:type I restriction enzyme, S subunit